MSDANVSLIADNLIQQKQIKPLIIVCPDLSAVGLYDDYLIRIVVPFVDSTFRTIQNRESRAIAGHSTGGLCSLYQALAHPEVFSIAGSFSCLMDMYKIQTIEGLLKEYDKASNPIRFWLYEGRKDVNRFGEANTELVEALKQNGLPTIHIEDDGDHISHVARRLGEFLEYLSECLN